MLSFKPLAALLVAVLLTIPRAVPMAYADGCQFVLGFATLAGLFPSNVGRCVDNEQHNPANGDGLQHTTNGLLVWRKADNVTVFTNGYYTILNGPQGLEERRNAQRFAWEDNPGGMPVVGYQPAGPAQFTPRPGPHLRLTDSTLGYVRGPLVFRLAGSGFFAGETVTLRGTYVPIYSLSTGNPQSPFHEVQCATIVLGPVQVMTDGTGGFTATIQAPGNPHTGGEVQITAAGSRGDGSGPVTEVAPEGTPVRAVPAGCKDVSGAT